MQQRLSPILVTVCNMNAHHKCKALAPNLCGVNQAQLADALLEIKRGSTAAASTHSAPPLLSTASQPQITVPPDTNGRSVSGRGAADMSR